MATWADQALVNKFLNMGLLITNAQPNPAGKDRRGRTLTPATQLAAEWVDFQNNGGTPVDLGGVELYHWAYQAGGGRTWDMVTGFTGILGAGEVVRVHSGDPIPLSQMRPEDSQGVHPHVFTRKDYVWNNDRDDFPRLWYRLSQQWLDETAYDAPAPEGRVLNRVGSKLI